jgi:hypothetical protein
MWGLWSRGWGVDADVGWGVTFLGLGRVVAMDVVSLAIGAGL